MCYDLPVRITLGNGPEMKEYGIHKGARGRIKAWTLHEDDVNRLANTKDAEVTLTQMPAKIIIKLETRMHKKHPDYVEQHFPLRPITN